MPDHQCTCLGDAMTFSRGASHGVASLLAIRQSISQGDIFAFIKLRLYHVFRVRLRFPIISKFIYPESIIPSL
jgi:hypothetical protein